MYLKGRKVRITDKNYGRYGQVGVVTGSNLCVYGMRYYVEFDDGSEALYFGSSFTVVEEQEGEF